MLTIIEEKIIKAMGRTLHLLAYADAVESGTLKGRSPGAGGDWDDVAPKTRPDAKNFAYHLAGRIEAMNGKSLLFLFRDAMRADADEALAKKPDDDQTQRWHAMEMDNLNGAQPTVYDEKNMERFGHCLVMQSLGHGVSWFDDHAEFPLRLPFVEFSY